MQPRRTIVLSDIHLSQSHPPDPHDPLWMRYRQSDYHPDADYAEFIDWVLDRFNGDEIELVWNGDVIDFDAPWVKDGTSSFDEFPLTDEGCAAQLCRITNDHPGWFAATARFLLAGHRLLVLSGNHDVELYWPSVRQALKETLAHHCSVEAKRSGIQATVDIDKQVRFRTWFHVTEDGIYIEHGSQYDEFDSVRYAMLPVTENRDWIYPVCGKLAFKRTGSRMGYFNPYYEETFYLGLFGYLGHFISRYAFSKHHIWRTWLGGSIRIVWEIWRRRHGKDFSKESRRLAHLETGSSLDTIDATQALTVLPADKSFIRILRLLWLDRITLFGLMLVITLVVLILKGFVVALGTVGILAVLFVVYEMAVPMPHLRDFDVAPPAVKALFDIHHVRALCMGHTHRALGMWKDGRFVGNSGTWAPAFHDELCTQPVFPKRPVLMLVSEGDQFYGGLHFWYDKQLVADSEGARG